MKCPRCESDTCPGRDDYLDCTALIDGFTARQEAIKAVARVGPYVEAIEQAENLARFGVPTVISVAKDEDGWHIETRAIAPVTKAPPVERAPAEFIEEVEHAVRGSMPFLSSEAQDRLIERLQPMMDEYARVVDSRVRRADTQAVARLVDVNIEARGEGASLRDVLPASVHAMLGLRLRPECTRLIFQAPNGDRTSVLLDEHRTTGKVSSD